MLIPPLWYSSCTLGFGPEWKQDLAKPKTQSISSFKTQSLAILGKIMTYAIVGFFLNVSQDLILREWFWIFEFVKVGKMFWFSSS